MRMHTQTYNLTLTTRNELATRTQAMLPLSGKEMVIDRTMKRIKLEYAHGQWQDEAGRKGFKYARDHAVIDRCTHKPQELPRTISPDQPHAVLAIACRSQTASRIGN